MLCDLFNMCVKSVSVSDYWKNAIPCKEGKQVSGQAYRVIILLSIPEKMVGRILVEKLQEVTIRKNWDL